MEKEHMQAERLPEAEKSEKKKRLPGFGGKKRHKWIVPAAVLLAAALLGSQAWKLKSGTVPQAVPYEAAPVQQRDLGVTVTGSATLEPADAYQVTTLLSGEILTAPFEQDGQVAKDAVLYTLDSSDAVFVYAITNVTNVKRMVKVTKNNEENALKSCSSLLHLRQPLSYDMDEYN